MWIRICNTGFRIKIIILDKHKLMCFISRSQLETEEANDKNRKVKDEYQVIEIYNRIKL